MNTHRQDIDSPSDRDLKVIQLLQAFHEHEENSGYFYGAAQLLISQLDVLYGINATPLPDASGDPHG